VTIGVARACNPASCDAANPHKIADFLGNIVHGSEMNRLRVQLVTDAEMASVCGTGALACYFSEEDQMFLSGSDDTSTDGATRDFVLTHEYGHHLANHRRNPPFQPTIDWGTKRWVTFERVCQGVRAGALFPGDEGAHYFDNPGEAFAEAFAFNRFPNLVGWQWTSALRPSRRSFAAIRQDALHPWKHRTRLTEAGSLGANGAQRAVEHLATPLDGIISLRLKAPAGADFDLTLSDRGGRVLRSAGGPGSRKVINYPLCGQARVKASVTRAGGGGRFRLIVNRP
jgi:hypothetical protein